MKSRSQPGKSGLSNPIFGLVSSFVLSFSSLSPVYAVDFEHGEIQGSFDTTVSYGQIHRTQSQAAELIGVSNGGTAFSVNGDDGSSRYNAAIIE